MLAASLCSFCCPYTHDIDSSHGRETDKGIGSAQSLNADKNDRRISPINQWPHLATARIRYFCPSLFREKSLCQVCRGSSRGQRAHVSSQSLLLLLPLHT